ncbi:cell division protein CrgA [Kribbella deserti]|uniref:Cell division protein CrgA n=1 Tax=Kribbella deserti TaxID=1926257 RepID=A0ABV6QTV7_9ACTN
MPESSSRNKKSSEKKAVEKTPKKVRTTSQPWVAPVMLGAWILGLAWLVVYYVAGPDVPLMKDLGNWNLLIGMGLIAVGFVVSTQWY